MRRTFVKFADIEDDLKANAPKVVYKYRTWTDPFHKALLSDQAAWFPHPFDLNDPLDLRPEIIFDLKEIDDPRYLQKMIAYATHMNTDRERRVVAENKLEEIKANPNILIENRNGWNATRGNFDRYGVFSTSTNGLTEKVWEEYADHYRGYCLGFNTVEMCRQMKAGYGYVIYTDDPFKHSFIDQGQDDFEILYLKKLKWSSEKEFRFITNGIGVYSERLQFFTPDTVSELILGFDIPAEHKKEIISVVQSKYPPTLKIFDLKRDNKGKLIKKAI